jgi:hypothetical protein
MYIITEIGTLADGKGSKAYKIFEIDEQGVARPTLKLKINDPVSAEAAIVRLRRLEEGLDD